MGSKKGESVLGIRVAHGYQSCRHTLGGFLLPKEWLFGRSRDPGWSERREGVVRIACGVGLGWDNREMLFFRRNTVCLCCGMKKKTE